MLFPTSVYGRIHPFVHVLDAKQSVDRGLLITSAQCWTWAGSRSHSTLSCRMSGRTRPRRRWGIFKRTLTFTHVHVHIWRLCKNICPPLYLVCSHPFPPANSTRSSKECPILSKPNTETNQKKGLHLSLHVPTVVQKKTVSGTCEECGGTGRIQGGLGAMPLFEWWPIKAFRPCPTCEAEGRSYTRRGQVLDEVMNSQDWTLHTKRSGVVRLGGCCKQHACFFLWGAQLSRCGIVVAVVAECGFGGPIDGCLF
jgi:hypothetical protein